MKPFPFLLASLGLLSSLGCSAGAEEYVETDATGGNAQAGAPTDTGGNATGGAPALQTGGTSSTTGGAATGGAPSPTGGVSTGGTATGGAVTGGTSTGGAATGGTSATGGASTGGNAAVGTGGTSTGGTSATGGAPAVNYCSNADGYLVSDCTSTCGRESDPQPRCACPRNATDKYGAVHMRTSIDSSDACSLPWVADGRACLRVTILTGTATVEITGTGPGSDTGIKLRCAVIRPRDGARVTAPATGTSWFSIEGADAIYNPLDGIDTCPLKCP